MSRLAAISSGLTLALTQATCARPQEVRGAYLYEVTCEALVEKFDTKTQQRVARYDLAAPVTMLPVPPHPDESVAFDAGHLEAAAFVGDAPQTTRPNAATESDQQAYARSEGPGGHNVGEECARTAVEMATLVQAYPHKK